jgi:copper chaperone CopZ
MIRNTVEIEGMACSMCEAHISDAIRKAFPDARKVKASHMKGKAEFLSEEPISEDAMKKAIEETGYHYQGMHSEPYQKHGLFHR